MTSFRNQIKIRKIRHLSETDNSNIKRQQTIVTNVFSDKWHLLTSTLQFTQCTKYNNSRPDLLGEYT